MIVITIIMCYCTIVMVVKFDCHPALLAKRYPCPIPKRCGVMLYSITPKNSMDKEDIVVNALTKLFFCGSDVPDTKLFMFFWLRTKEEVMGIETCVVAEQDNEVSVFTN